MVITTQKPWEEIQEALGDRKRWIVLGCAHCAAVCQTGGSAQADDMARRLEEAGCTVLAVVDLPSPCDRRLSRRDLRRVERELGQAEGILCLSCGGGAQAVASLVEVPVVAGLDAHFVGTVERVGRFFEECALCGACLLNDTAGLCPVTGCPKGLRNGPCEQDDALGRCGVLGDRECVWESVYARLQAQGRAEAFGRIRAPVPPSAWGRPRSTAGRGR